MMTVNRLRSDLHPRVRAFAYARARVTAFRRARTAISHGQSGTCESVCLCGNVTDSTLQTNIIKCSCHIRTLIPNYLYIIFTLLINLTKIATLNPRPRGVRCIAPYAPI